jgi:hypothetical protein
MRGGEASEFGVEYHEHEALEPADGGFVGAEVDVADLRVAKAADAALPREAVELGSTHIDTASATDQRGHQAARARITQKR